MEFLPHSLWSFHHIQIFQKRLYSDHKRRQDAKKSPQKARKTPAPKSLKYCKYCNGRRFFANAKPPVTSRNLEKNYRSLARKARRRLGNFSFEKKS